MIVLVERAGTFAVPTGSTVLQPADKLLVLATDEGVRSLQVLADPPTS
jgi:Trk K+ transport system NAD-binding subunit